MIISMLYHTTTILVFRPLISHARSKLLPESFYPLGSCTSSVVKISTMAKAYRARYSLRNISNIAVHAVFTAVTIHLCNLDSANVSYEPNARQYLGNCLSFLEEIGNTWPSALRYLHVIHSLIAKYHVAQNNSVTQLATSKDGASPKDYTREKRIEQRVLGSLPAIPQLLPQSSLATQQQIQTSRSISDAPGAMELPSPLPTDALKPQQYYIPTDFDMSFFDVADMSTFLSDTHMTSQGDLGS